MNKILIVIIIGLVLLASFVIVSQEDEEISFGDLEISSNNLKDIVSPLPEGRYLLCSLKEEDKDSPCVPMFKGGLE